MSRAEKIVQAIIDDLTDRRGLKHAWSEIDGDVQQEIRQAWAKIINEVGNTQDPAKPKFPAIYFEVTTAIGADIAVIVDEAVRIAVRTDMTLRVPFQDQVLFIGPNDRTDVFLKNWRKKR